MKKIYLIRHAKSSWDHPDLDDFERPLNQRGKRDAPFMGQRLKKYGIFPDLFLSSPAVRALKTARKIARQINFPRQQIKTYSQLYMAELTDFLEIIHSFSDPVRQVFLVSHNPGITELAQYLTHKEVAHMPTAAIFCIEFQCRQWDEVHIGSGEPVFFDFPKKHLR